jgi:hypothetical protein
MNVNFTSVEGERVEIREPQARFRLVPFDEITLGSDRVYLVKGIIPRSGLVVIWGSPKCGKSFWTFDLAMHVALGWEYRGRRVHQGVVVYLALEGGHGFRARIEAFRQRFLSEDPDPVSFYLITDALDLAKDHPELIDCIRQQANGAPIMVVIDTLNRSLAGSESDDKDMAAYIRAADAIRNAFGCAVIVVHHCGIDATRPRGHTSLAAAVDAQLAVKRDSLENIVVTVERMKDGQEGDRLISKLESIEEVGTDSDGDPITSCVVVPVDGEAAREAPNRKLSDRQQLALDALTDCATEHGKPPPGSFGLPAGLLAVELNQWREELLARGTLDRDAANPRQDFRRLKESLQRRKLIGAREDLVWRP